MAVATKERHLNTNVN